ncbi:MAG: hypothetical protein ACYDCQ_19805, partial [Dehalococcoidia bacterium]
AARGSLSFVALISGCRGREEIISTFFAVLEMIKRVGLVATQAEAFGDIVLVAAALETELAGVQQPDRV